MAGFSIVTNVNSLLAQENLSKTNSLQQRTIQRLTSGLRINSSSDDAAGLAVANKFRSDISVLQQGVRNAADGLSTLQTIDGGLNNISMLIDRARTLATQSASGTFQGDRGTLNEEFQSVVSEINRQAQAIGLDPGGDFNKSLAVFIGGGRANGNISETQNGALSIDLSNSAVNGQRLGLEGVRALGGVEGTTDLGNSSSTSVQNIVSNANNLASLNVSGYTEFSFSGPGFSDDGSATLSVNLAGVVDTNTLAAAVNNAIEGFSAASAAGQAFKDANIRAVVNTDSSGKQQLSFTSSDTAFQVKAEDKVANALMGNFASGAEGASLDVTRTGAVRNQAQTASNTVQVTFNGGGMLSESTISITTQIGDDQADMISAINTAIQADSTLAGAGFEARAGSVANTVEFANSNGETFNVRVVGDADDTLGFGGAVASGGDATYNSISTTGLDTTAGGTATFQVLMDGSESAQSLSVAIGAGATDQEVADAINTAIAGNSELAGAGLFASVNAGEVQFDTTTNGGGQNFTLAVDGGTVTDIGLAESTTALTAGTRGEASTTSGVVNSGGAQSTTASGAAVSFSGLAGNDVQNLSLSAKDATGAVQSINISLDSSNAGTLDQALNAINDQLQASNNDTLQQIVAVKERNGVGQEGIRLMANLPQGFSVSVGDMSNNHGVDNDSSSDLLLSSDALAGGSVADIGSRENAERAVTLLAEAVGKLGDVQANVGKAQNRLQYAMSLASTQITNLSAAESRIRDADLATEAANMTRAGIAQQAGVAALAQANSAPQAVLSLLRG